MNPLIGAALISGGAGLLGSLIGAQKEEEAFKRQLGWLREQAEEERARRARARGHLAGYRYTPYHTPYTPFEFRGYEPALKEQTRGLLAQYLAGTLTPAQEQQLAHQRALGEAGIARMAAGRGMPGGAQAALAAQLGRDIGLGAAQIAERQQQLGLQMTLPYEQMWERQFLTPQEVAREERERAYRYALADYLREQEARARLQELLAQYA